MEDQNKEPFNNDLSDVVHTRHILFSFFRRKLLKVRILKADGCTDFGYAEPCFGGFVIYDEHNLFNYLGVNGLFPDSPGCNWLRWEFVRK